MSGPFGYNPSIPQATDIIAQSQPQLLQNASSVMSIMDVNHGDFATAVAGQHNYVQMYLQGAAPAVNVGDVGLFNLAVAGTNEMNVRKSDGTNVPMTKANLNLPGYTYLASGIILQWGFITATTNPFAVTFPLPFPTKTLSVNISMSSSGPADPNAFCQVIIPLSSINLGFSVSLNKRDSKGSFPSSPGQFYYLAIGY